MSIDKLTLLCVGDLVFDSPEADRLADFVRPTLKSADVVVGQMEVVFTARGERQYTPVPSPPTDPRNMGAMISAGFSVLTLAGNHVWDSGPPGIEDSIEGLRSYGVAFTGAGMNIDEARKPAVIERKGTRIGFLDYNCAGPKDSWATPEKPGCAYLDIITHYEQGGPTPGIRPFIYTFADPRTVKAMTDDIRKLRKACDVLVVVFHKGVTHIPAYLGMYEQPICYAAIDAGADLVLGHHAHILRGIEFYRGRPIFHGLGNFITATMALTEAPNWRLGQWIKLRKELAGFEPDPLNPSYPFHRDSRKTIIAKCEIEHGKIVRTGYIPCFINRDNQPEILKNDERGAEVFEYVDFITKETGLHTTFRWEGDEVAASAEEEP